MNKGEKEMEFKVGDRVKVCGYTGTFDVEGKCGTVRDTKGVGVTVFFDKNIGGWGDLTLGIPYGYGLHIANYALKLIGADNTVREIKRPAKHGDYIKIITYRKTLCNGHSLGDIVLIDGHEERPDDEGFIWGTGLYFSCDDSKNEYVVLENYQPPKEDKPHTVIIDGVTYVPKA